jgi:hypothetical protein
VAFGSARPPDGKPPRLSIGNGGERHGALGAHEEPIDEVDTLEVEQLARFEEGDVFVCAGLERIVDRLANARGRDQNRRYRRFTFKRYGELVGENVYLTGRAIDDETHQRFAHRPEREHDGLRPNGSVESFENGDEAIGNRK